MRSSSVCNKNTPTIMHYMFTKNLVFKVENTFYPARKAQLESWQIGTCFFRILVIYAAIRMACRVCFSKKKMLFLRSIHHFVLLGILTNKIGVLGLVSTALSSFIPYTRCWWSPFFFKKTPFSRSMPPFCLAWDAYRESWYVGTCFDHILVISIP